MSNFTDLHTARQVLEAADAVRSCHWMTAAGRSTLREAERDHLVVQVAMGSGIRHLRLDPGDVHQLADVLPDGVLS
jgi:hypothetical protein